MGTPTATAAPIEFREQRAQFMVFDDVDGSVENANWYEREPFLAGYQQVEDGLLAVHPDDSQFIVVYTTWSLAAGIGAFFQSVANDVAGIGFAHIAAEDPVLPAEFFDDTPNSQVQGMLHMNRWTQYLGTDPGGTNDSIITLIFGQELGHAWGSFVYYDQGAGMQTDLLGRANAHWSFYMDTGGSPMQGHRWTDNGDGTFTATKTDLYLFSDLDLYLMGLLPEAEVAPWFVLADPFDCFDAAAGDDVCAPPQAFSFEADTYTVGATRRDVSVQDVIAAEGARVPAWPDAPDNFDVSFVLIKRPGETLTDEELDALDGIIARSIELFALQTRDRGHVINRTASDTPGGDTGLDDSGTGTPPTTDGEDLGSGTASTDASGTGSPAATGNDGTGCGCRSPRRGSAGPGATALMLLLLAARGRARPQSPQ